jgi:hypothetical protein
MYTWVRVLLRRLLRILDDMICQRFFLANFWMGAEFDSGLLILVIGLSFVEELKTISDSTQMILSSLESQSEIMLKSKHCIKRLWHFDSDSFYSTMSLKCQLDRFCRLCFMLHFLNTCSVMWIGHLIQNTKFSFTSGCKNSSRTQYIIEISSYSKIK